MIPEIIVLQEEQIFMPSETHFYERNNIFVKKTHSQNLEDQCIFATEKRIFSLKHAL